MEAGEFAERHGHSEVDERGEEITENHAGAGDLHGSGRAEQQTGTD